MPELLAPASSPEAVIAAVQNGADAVYFSYGGIVPKSRGYNFTRDEFRYATEYCRVRGVKTYIDLRGLVGDEGLGRLAAVLRVTAELGADAVIMDDLGALRTARAVVPDMPVHTGGCLAVHCLGAAERLAELGVSRIALSPELSREETAYIALKSTLETEVQVHGPMCAAHGGTCLMSAYLTGESSSRGLCTKPCGEEFTIAKSDGRFLACRDVCLAEHLDELEKCGVTALRIDGDTRRPEYAALVTGIYSRALASGRPPEEAELQRIREALSLREVSDAAFAGDREKNIFGQKPKSAPDDNLVLAETRREYLSGEYQRVPVNFAAIVRPGSPVKFAAEDDRGIMVSVEGPLPAAGGDNPISYSRLKTLFHRTDGTPFKFGSLKVSVTEGLEIPTQTMTGMLRELLQKLMDERRAYSPIGSEEYHPGLKYINPKGQPAITVSVSTPEQMTPELAGMKPALLYVPLDIIAEYPKTILPFWENDYTDVVVSLPRVIHDSEKSGLLKKLEFASKIKLTDAAVHDAGHIKLAESFGFNVRGDTGLNVYNSQSMRALKDMGLVSAALSYELSFKQVRELSKAIDTELVVYGRIPLMTTDRCVLKAAVGRCVCGNTSQLLDKKGAAYPVLKSGDCCNTIYSGSKLFFGSNRRVYHGLGLWGARLCFTTENPSECVQVMERYLGRGHYEPTGKTRGMYPRGIE